MKGLKTSFSGCKLHMLSIASMDVVALGATWLFDYALMCFISIQIF